jgi:uncharacterized membrane protein
MRPFALAVVSLTALAFSPTLAMAQAATAAGAGTGALAGAVVGGPVGAAVGGVIGGVVGASAERPRHRVVRIHRRAAAKHHRASRYIADQPERRKPRRESHAFRPLG